MKNFLGMTAATFLHCDHSDQGTTVSLHHLTAREQVDSLVLMQEHLGLVQSGSFVKITWESVRNVKAAEEQNSAKKTLSNPFLFSTKSQLFSTIKNQHNEAVKLIIEALKHYRSYVITKTKGIKKKKKKMKARMKVGSRERREVWLYYNYIHKINEICSL